MTKPSEPVIVSRSDLAALGACALALSAWTSAATGAFSAAIVAVWIVVCAAFYAAGMLVARVMRLSSGLLFDFPLRMTIGYVLVNTTLMALAWSSARALRVGFVVMVVLLIVGVARMRPSFARREGDLPALLTTIVSLAAATLWAQDSLRPLQVTGDATVFTPWIDAFFHTARTATLSGAHGAGAPEDVRLAHVAAPFYHYAPYATPALVTTFSPVSAYASFAGILLPFGTLLTGLAAYSFVATFFGGWSGFAAACFVLVLPDASHHFLRTPFFGYHWLQAVAPAGPYAVAVLALTWLFLIRGCQQGNLAQVGAAFVGCALVVFYKAQFFVASAFLCWVVPPFAFRGLTARTRAAWSLTALVMFVAAIVVANRLPSVPLLRLDGSATRRVLENLVLATTEEGAVKSWFASHLGTDAPPMQLWIFGAPMLLGCTFGLFTLLYAASAVALRKKFDALYLSVPALIVANFVVMALGAAYDTKAVGTVEELNHRPFVWAYFVCAAWTGGALSLAARERWRFANAAFVVSSFLLLVVPLRLGANLQDKTKWTLANVKVPTGLVHSAAWLRAHAGATDVVQASDGDRYVILAALSERRSYVVDYFIAAGSRLDEIARRRALVERLRTLDNAAQIETTAHDLGIQWFVLVPGETCAWPAPLLDAPAYQSGGYRVYRFR